MSSRNTSGAMMANSTTVAPVRFRCVRPFLLGWGSMLIVTPSQSIRRQRRSWQKRHAHAARESPCPANERIGCDRLKIIADRHRDIIPIGVHADVAVLQRRPE